MSVNAKTRNCTYHFARGVVSSARRNKVGRASVVVGAPHFSATSMQRFGIDMARFVNKEAVISSHTRVNAFFPQSTESNCFPLAYTLRERSAHAFSIGLRSGLLVGHARTLSPLSINHSEAWCAVCALALSCWYVHSKAWASMKGSRWSSRGAVYTASFHKDQLGHFDARACSPDHSDSAPILTRPFPTAGNTRVLDHRRCSVIHQVLVCYVCPFCKNLDFDPTANAKGPQTLLKRLDSGSEQPSTSHSHRSCPRTTPFNRNSDLILKL